jgi:hypothetical protein
MVGSAFFQFDVRLSRLRRCRGMFAVLLSLMLVFSSSHCWCLDEIGGGTLTLSAAATDCDSGENQSGTHVPHCEHCMAHVITVAPPATSITVEYVTDFYRAAFPPAPETVDLASPFKPPRV